MRIAGTIGACLLLLWGAGPALQASERQVVVTVEPGTRMADFCRQLEALGVGSAEDVAKIAAGDPLRRYPFLPPAEPDIARFEGMFVPGVYRLEVPSSRGASRAVDAVIRQLLDRSLERFSGARIDNGLDRYQSAVLASIVEKEAVGSGQQGLVASTLLNRMREGMRLSCCSTVEYALGYHRPFLLASDIDIASPYNTYRHPGLPPTPICFFTDAAWAAATRPPASPYLFFVYDWAASEVRFAADYPDHVRNVALARADFIQAFGAGALHRKFPGLFYEPIPGSRSLS